MACLSLCIRGLTIATLVDVSPLELHAGKRKREKMQKKDSDVLCVCVMARWNMSLCDVSEGRHVSRGRSPVPPRSLRSNTPGWSLWCAPCWENKQSKGRKAVSDKSLALRSQIIIPLIIFIGLITPRLLKILHSKEIFILTTHLIW